MVLLRANAKDLAFLAVFLLIPAGVMAVSDSLWFTLFVTIGLIVSWAVGLLNRPGVRATASNQPALAALVGRVAAITGSPPPDRIWLTGSPHIAAQVSAWRRDLHVGMPLLRSLSTSQVQALVGHELSILGHRRPWLVTRLMEQWTDATKDIHLADGEPDRKDVRLSAVLNAFATEVHRHADAAALTVGGGADVSASAYARAEVVDETHRRYVFLCDDIPRSRWWHPWPSKIADLDDGWRHVLAHGVSGTFWDEDAALTAPQHPTLAAALLRLGNESLVLRPADDPVPLEPLSLREQKRLAREALGIPSRVIV